MVNLCREWRRQQRLLQEELIESRCGGSPRCQEEGTMSSPAGKTDMTWLLLEPVCVRAAKCVIFSPSVVKLDISNLSSLSCMPRANHQRPTGEQIWELPSQKGLGAGPKYPTLTVAALIRWYFGVVSSVIFKMFFWVFWLWDRLFLVGRRDGKTYSLSCISRWRKPGGFALVAKMRHRAT